MHNRIIIYVLSMVCVAGLLSCASSASNVGIGEFVFSPDGDYSFINNVVINNQELSRYIQIVDIKGKMVNNLLQAQIQVINKYDKDYRFEYRFAWYDSKGFEIRSVKEHWVPVLIYGQETKTLVGLAPDPETIKFRVNIRPAHPVK